MGIHKLKMGAEQPSASPAEEQRRIDDLKATVAHYLPDFVRGVASTSEGDNMVIHQDSFAAGYDLDEYTMLGMAIKYAGLHGVVIHIIGKNHETF